MSATPLTKLFQPASTHAVPYYLEPADFWDESGMAAIEVDFGAETLLTVSPTPDFMPGQMQAFADNAWEQGYTCIRFEGQNGKPWFKFKDPTKYRSPANG